MSDRHDQLLKLLLHAYPDRVTVRRANDPSRGVMVGGRAVVLEPASVVRRGALFLSLDPRDVESGGEARVALASAIREEWLEEIFPHLTQRRVEHRFDAERGRVMSWRQVVFAGLVVRETVASAAAERAGADEALFEYLAKEPAAFFAGDEAAARWLARARFLRRAMPELELPELDDESLREALREACAGCASPDQARAKGRLTQILENRLTWKQRQALADHAPEALAVPSGSRIRLAYGDDGPPVLAVRLQELFGLAESPRVAAGRAAVQLHLLGPNFRPVQVTQDLRSFWGGAYQEVRRDLRARYPKHPWPEDPWNAPPAAVGRRRRG